MLGRVEKSIEIKAPPENVWEMLAMDKFPEWDEGTQKNVKSVEYTSEIRTPEDKYRVGASVHLKTKKGEGIYLEVTESLENKKITYRMPLTSTILAYILEPVEKGTKLNYIMDYELPWWILGKFLNKLFFQRMAGNEVDRSLEQLKNLLEK